MITTLDKLPIDFSIIGTRVIANNLPGRIINIQPYPEGSFFLVLVEFDQVIKWGHDGNGLGKIHGKKGQCYWFSTSLDKILVRNSVQSMMEKLEI